MREIDMPTGRHGFVVAQADFCIYITEQALEAAATVKRQLYLAQSFQRLSLDSTSHNPVEPCAEEIGCTFKGNTSGPSIP